MKTVSSPAEGIFKEKGSRFLSYIYPVRDEEEIRQILIRIRKEHHSARHHCYAWRLGTEEFRTRSSDDGEPSSTAGKPILGQITANDLTQVLIVVVRYFGGILLGTGGLIQAYRSAAADAIDKSTAVKLEPELGFKIECGYQQLNQVYQIIHHEGFRVLESHLADQCGLTIAVKKSVSDHAAFLLGSIYGVKVSNAMLIND